MVGPIGRRSGVGHGARGAHKARGARGAQGAGPGPSAVAGLEHRGPGVPRAPGLGSQGWRADPPRLVPGLARRRALWSRAGEPTRHVSSRGWRTHPKPSAASRLGSGAGDPTGDGGPGPRMPVMPTPPDARGPAAPPPEAAGGPATRPLRIHADRATGTLAIVWADGHGTTYDAETLRRLCPCAYCRGEAGLPGWLDSNPTFGPAQVQLVDVSLVGQYAIKPTWGDGHDTGFYTFALLREACPCEVCSTRRSV